MAINVKTIPEINLIHAIHVNTNLFCVNCRELVINIIFGFKSLRVGEFLLGGYSFFCYFCEILVIIKE